MARINANRAFALRAGFGLGGPTGATAGVTNQTVTDNKGAVKNDGTADSGTGGQVDMTQGAVSTAFVAADAVVSAAFAAADTVLALADAEQTLAASASNATACNAALGRSVTVPVLTENTVVTISNLAAGQSITFKITQHASSAKTLTFSPVPTWPGGTTYVASAGASAIDLVTIFRTGATYYGMASKAMA